MERAVAAENFNTCLDLVLVHEGGWADHPKDPGGATMRGVTLATYRRYKPGATKAQLKAITTDELRRIYRDGYWLPVKGDALPWGVDYATFDFSVNSGPSRSAKHLQKVVGVKQDGVVGPNTLKAVAIADGKTVIQKLCASRMSFLKGLSTFSTFGKGWTRRVAECEAKAVSMWLSRGKALTQTDRDALATEGAKADSAAKNQNAGAGGSVVGGGSAAVVDGSWIGFVVLGVLIVAAVFFVVKSRQNKERAAAYQAAALAAE